MAHDAIISWENEGGAVFPPPGAEPVGRHDAECDTETKQPRLPDETVVTSPQRLSHRREVVAD
jgi:hypothetical protein